MKYLLALTFALSVLPQVAQAASDTLNVSVDKNQSFGWKFSFFNSHATNVNTIILTIVTPNVKFLNPNVEGPAANNNWFGDEDTSGTFVTWTTTLAIQQNRRDSLFTFSLDFDTSLFDKPIVIQWQTKLSTIPVGSGQFFVRPTYQQSLTRLDSVAVSSTVLPSGDPFFDYKVFNHNSSSSQIDGMSFEVLSATTGGFRPSAVIAPTGWVLDSVTNSLVSYHAIPGNGINSGQSLDGFKAAMRSNPVVDKFHFVWRAYSGGALIDRDTVLNVPATPGGGTSQTSNDTVVLAKQKACLFALGISNYHTSNGLLPGRIGRVRLKITTPGVLFTESDSLPSRNWATIGGAINGSAGSDTMIYLAASYADDQPSGLTYGYGFTVNNPTGNPFSIDWQTLDSTRVLGSGSMTLNCGGVVSADSATLTSNGCNYTLVVKNKHSQTSGIHSVVLQVPTGLKFSTTTTKPAGWDVSQTQDNAIRFFANGSSNDIASGGNGTFTFSLTTPTTGSSLQWTSSDFTSGNEHQTGSGTFPISCSIATSCDTVVPSLEASIDGNLCAYGFSITNRRTDQLSVTSVTIAASNGWKIDTAVPQFTWSSAISSDGSSVTYTSPTGFLAQKPKFIVGFMGASPDSFQVTVTTSDNNQKLCTSSMLIQCAPNMGVSEGGGLTESLSLSISPNPLVNRANITFHNTQHERVSITLLDVLGRPVQSVVEGMFDEGDHATSLDASSLIEGTYYLHLETLYGRMTKRLVIQK